MEIHNNKNISLIDRYVAMLYIYDDNIVSLVEKVKCSEVRLLSSASHICCIAVSVLFPRGYNNIEDFHSSKKCGSINEIFTREFKKFDDFNELCDCIIDTLNKIFKFVECVDEKSCIEDCINSMNDIKNKYKSCTSLSISEQ